MSGGTIVTKWRRAGKSQWVEGLGRAGLVAQGVLYAVVGILAIEVARGGSEQRPDRDGALSAIAEQPFGRVLLVVLALGLAGYAAWRFAQAFLDRDGQGDGLKGLAKRASAFARGGWYAVLCGLTIERIFEGRSGGGGGGNEKKATGGVFDLPLGRYLVAAVGLAFLGAGVFNGYRAVTCKFERKLKKRKMSAAEEALARGLGIVGFLARFVIFALIGLFLVKAAWEFDPKEARGLDGALLELSRQPYGGLLIGAVGAGLIAYALYCVVQARYRDV
jgi:hypothetical protein